MKLITRRLNSQRTAEPIEVTFEPNFTGQGGLPFLTLKSGDKYYMLSFESQEEVRDLLSQAHIVHHNFYDDLQRQEALRAIKGDFGVSS